MTQNFVSALILTTLAGLSTTFGSLLSLLYKKPGPVYMAFTLGFSSGVMVLISFTEMLSEGIHTLGFNYAILAFFAGLVLMFGVDVAFSHKYIIEEYYSDQYTSHNQNKRLIKTSILVAIGIAIHNFPEGIATFAVSLNNLKIGLAMAFAIAIHNIPEGIAVSVPVYAATKSRKKAFFWSFLSGVSEPIGAICAAAILMPFINDTTLHWTLCLVAGFMVYIALDELLPASHKYGLEHTSILGVILGMAVMALSLAII